MTYPGWTTLLRVDTHPDQQRPARSPTPVEHRSKRTSLSRVALGTYKSIRACDVKIGDVTFLIGRNGAGKSNFLDGLRFVHDAVNTNLEAAVTAHGSPGSLRTVGTDQLSVELYFTLVSGEALYKITLRTPGDSFEVTEEILTLTSNGVALNLIPPSADESSRRTLSLAVAAAASKDAKIVYDYIRSMRFYDFSLPAIRKVQTPSQGELLRPDGGNLASVLGRMEPDKLERLHEYMREILPGITQIQRKQLGPGEAIQFNTPSRVGFFAHHMSSGTLLALAVLVAILQPPDANEQKASLIALEEPEGSLHPAAVGVLFDAIMEASNDRQTMVATQSPDLLDRGDLPPDSILAVVSGEQGSELGPVDRTTRKALQSHLFTAGELIRLDQIRPAES